MLPAPSLVRVRVPGASWAPRSVFRSTSSAALVQRLAAPGGAPSNSQGRHTHLRGNGRPAVSWLGAGKAAAAQGAAARLAQGEAHDSPQRHGRRLLQFVSRDEVEIVGDAADCGGHAQKFPGYRSKGNVDTFQHHARRGLSHHSATAPRPILKIRIQSSLLGSMSVAVPCACLGAPAPRAPQHASSMLSPCAISYSSEIIRFAPRLPCEQQPVLCFLETASSDTST